MSRVRKYLDRIQPLFIKGGRLEKYYALYEMVDTFLYTPSKVTAHAPHVRDAIDIKRVMAYVVLATLPCIVIGLWNIGYQANTAMLQMGMEMAPGLRGELLSILPGSYDPNNVIANFLHGLSYFLPIYLVTLLAGGFWEVLFASVRNH